MWKYNPNYSIRFKNCPRIILPPIQVSHKHKDNTHESLLNTLSNTNDNLDDSVIHRSINNSLVKKTEDEAHDKSRSRETETLNKTTPHHIISDTNIVKHSHKRRMNTPFSRKNKAIKFDKCTGREDLKIPLTNDINYVVTEPRK